MANVLAFLNSPPASGQSLSAPVLLLALNAPEVSTGVPAKKKKSRNVILPTDKRPKIVLPDRQRHMMGCTQTVKLNKMNR